MLRRDLYTALFGNILQYYNATLYGFLAAKLAPIFFPSIDERLSLLASMATFAAGYASRPIGGLLFGYVGDRIGRNKAVIYALAIGAIPSVVMGLLPTYSSIGLLSPILLIIVRLLQGLSVAGEWAGITVYILEKSPISKLNFLGSCMTSSGFLGALFAVVGAGICYIDESIDWLWRIPFLLGGCLAIANLVVRSKVPIKLKAKVQKGSKMPLVVIFQNQKIALMSSFFLGATSTSAFYLSTFYISSIYQTHLGISFFAVSLINVIIMLLWIALLPVAGRYADRIGTMKAILSSLLFLASIAYPAFMLIGEKSFEGVLLAQLLLTFASIAILSCTSGVLLSIFDKAERCSALGFGYTLGAAILGSTMPTIAIAFERLNGDFSSPALLLILLALLSFLSLKFFLLLPVRIRNCPI